MPVLDIGYWTPLPSVVAWGLVILDLGSGGQLVCGFLGKEPWLTEISNLQKLPGVVYEEWNLNGLVKTLDKRLTSLPAPNPNAYTYLATSRHIV